MRRLIGWSGAGPLVAVALLLGGCGRPAGPTAPAVVRLIPQPPPREGPPPIPAEPPAARAEKAPAPAENKPAPAAPAPQEKTPAPEEKKPAPAAPAAEEKKPAPDAGKPGPPAPAALPDPAAPARPVPDAGKPAPPPPDAAPAPAPPPDARPAPAQPGLRRVLDRLVVENALKQIALFYHIYLTDIGRPPARLDDFLDYIKTDGRLEYRALKDGSLVLELTPEVSSTAMLAYEKDPAADGTRMAVMGDTSVQRLTAEQFEKALPKK